MSSSWHISSYKKKPFLIHDVAPAIPFRISLHKRKISAIFLTVGEVEEQGPEPEFVNLLRSPGINSQLGVPVRQPYLTYHTDPSGYIGWRNRFLGIGSWAPQTFTNSLCYEENNFFCLAF